jgi:hypothetical protein
VPTAFDGSTAMTLNPVPGPLRMLTPVVVRTVLPTGIPPVTVAVRVGVRVGVRVAVAGPVVRVAVGVAEAPGPETSVR